jgi:hypothetical protein
MNDDEYIRESVRRRVGKVVLARLKRIAAEDERQQALNAAWARRLTGVLIVAAILALIWLVLH